MSNLLNRLKPEFKAELMFLQQKYPALTEQIITDLKATEYVQKLTLETASNLTNILHEVCPPKNLDLLTINSYFKEA